MELVIAMTIHIIHEKIGSIFSPEEIFVTRLHYEAGVIDLFADTVYNFYWGFSYTDMLPIPVKGGGRASRGPRR